MQNPPKILSALPLATLSLSRSLSLIHRLQSGFHALKDEITNKQIEYMLTNAGIENGEYEINGQAYRREYDRILGQVQELEKIGIEKREILDRGLWEIEALLTTVGLQQDREQLQQQQQQYQNQYQEEVGEYQSQKQDSKDDDESEGQCKQIQQQQQSQLKKQCVKQNQECPQSIKQQFQQEQQLQQQQQQQQLQQQQKYQLYSSKSQSQKQNNNSIQQNLSYEQYYLDYSNPSKSQQFNQTQKSQLEQQTKKSGRVLRSSNSKCAKPKGNGKGKEKRKDSDQFVDFKQIGLENFLDKIYHEASRHDEQQQDGSQKTQSCQSIRKNKDTSLNKSQKIYI